MYALTVAKGGLKTKPINDGDCTENDHAMGPKWLDQVRRGEKGFCNFVYGEAVGPGTMGWAFGGHTMGDFASIVSGWVNRHVVDQTGASGRFRIYLEVADNVGLPRLEGASRGPDANGQTPEHAISIALLATTDDADIDTVLDQLATVLLDTNSP